ncbi:hypothetical protein SKAU_G00025240 [Synaphobranchus kaupii]|uniref:Uncharacterized protein n=1 Tax=Synaphobranchus kaupii TaxID=118154 RepID=A0A9Q1JCL9_SYNKA|nr:hypothetical protein SKAU_G00025240 [Synaphobranchus kaupii]
MVQQQEIMFRLTLNKVLCVACRCQCALLCVCLLGPLLASSSLLCNFCPLHRKGLTCPTFTTECKPQERCYSGRGLYHGSIHILSAQGSVSRELCGTVQPIEFMGISYSINYTCCCRDKCNLPPELDNTLKMLFGKTVSSHKGGITMNTTVDDCPEDNSLQENTKHS